MSSPTGCAALDRDLVRVSSALSEGAESPREALHITVDTSTETKQLTVAPNEAVHDALARAWEFPPLGFAEVLLGTDAVPPGESFEQWGIEAPVPVITDGRRLCHPSVDALC